MTGNHIRKRLVRATQMAEPADEATRSALDALDAAMEQIVRIECAEARAQDRLRTLETTILSCLSEREHSDTPHQGLQALLADLAQMEETLPIERAFRDDERDRAMATIAEAQRVLDAARGGPSHRVGMALALGPDQIGQSARIFARISGRQYGYAGLM